MSDSSNLSRRELLGGAALAAGIAATPAALASAAASREQLVPVNKTYRALVRRPGASGPAQIEKVRLRPLSGRQVLVRVTAVQCCYSDVRGVLGNSGVPGAAATTQSGAHVLGHQGVGEVELIGPQVTGLRPGDKVFISVTAQCGRCYNCVRGRADACYASNSLPSPVIGELMDGTPIAQDEGGGGIGGLSEYTVNYEERLTPIFSRASAEEISMLTCPGSTGLGMTCTLHPIESGATVVVFGCGPVGLSAIQGARIQGASRIIAVEPIARRREVALKVGATDAVDPNAAGDHLVEQLREMTRGSTDRIFAGGQSWADAFGNPGRWGPDYVIEAVGRQAYAPKVESALDPTGIQALEQVWELVPPGGYGMTSGFGYAREDTVTFNAQRFTNASKTMVSCQGGGIQSKRDLPRFVRLIEDGRYDAKALISNVYRFDDVVKAYQEVADRTVIGNVISFS